MIAQETLDPRRRRRQQRQASHDRQRRHAATSSRTVTTCAGIHSTSAVSRSTTPPQRVLDALKRAQETIDRLQAEAQAIVFGAAIGLGVPDDWQWDGRGWAAPMPADPAAYAPTPEDAPA